MTSRTAFQIIFSLILLILFLACTKTASAQRFKPLNKSQHHQLNSAARQTIPTGAKFADPDYPDPKRIRPPERVYAATPATPVNLDRYAKISEQEHQRRVRQEACMKECGGMEGAKAEPCPLCEDDPKTPCGKCKMCVAGFPCEKTLCRHCVQQRSQNMCNSCDLSAGDEPCGTCDACREHRSDPCEHADDGHGPRGEFNPYKEPRFMSVIPRPILDMYNNGARKHPVYYNPAPYYRPHWNPSLYAGYARPYTFRWSCPLCHKEPCQCDKPGYAGQVPYAYSCRFCNRNPCACTQDICNVTKELNPSGVAKALNDEVGDSTRIQDAERRQQARQESAARERAKAERSLTDADDGSWSGRTILDDTDEKLESLRKVPTKEETRSRMRELLDDHDDEEGPSFESMRPQTLDAPELNSPSPRRSGGLVN